MTNTERSPAIAYWQNSTRYEREYDYLNGLPDPLRAAYRMCADMIENGTAAPEGVIVGGRMHTMDYLQDRYGPYWQQ